MNGAAGTGQTGSSAAAGGWTQAPSGARRLRAGLWRRGGGGAEPRPRQRRSGVLGRLPPRAFPAQGPGREVSDPLIACPAHLEGDTPPFHGRKGIPEGGKEAAAAPVHASLRVGAAGPDGH